MKNFLLASFLLLTGFGYPQKYVLIDKKMVSPISYTNTVTVEHSYKNLFAVETNHIHPFIAEVEKIAEELTSHKNTLPQSFDFNIGSTNFKGLKIHLAKEERMDVLLTTNCEGLITSMHLCNAKYSNANNAFYVNTWLKYIKSSIK